MIAKSFARIFFRNAINIGLPILECPAAVDGIQPGDEVEVEPAAGAIRNLDPGTSFRGRALPGFSAAHHRIAADCWHYVEDRLAERSA